MIMEISRKKWGMIVNISPLLLGNDYGNTWGMILEIDTKGDPGYPQGSNGTWGPHPD